jgi:D-glycero-alpha-D-manno-heptose-7-phosphate kinase
MIIVKTPFRISFFGGGTDYPAWYRKNGGAVLSTTIDKYSYITCRYLPPFFEHKHRIVYSHIENVQEVDQIEHPAVRAVLGWAKVNEGLEMHYDGDLPARSGLGSSSSFTVGLIHALSGLRGKMISKYELASNAINIEQNILKENVGSQDQISAAYGGFNRIIFDTDDSFIVEPVTINPLRRSELASHLMLFFTGFSRIADSVAKSQIDNFDIKEKELKLMGQMVNEAIDLLVNIDTSIDEFGKLLHESWRIKRGLSSMVTNNQIDSIYEAAMEAGAIGGKILGAGGGGFMLVFAKPEKHAAIRERLKKLIYVSFNFEDGGSRVALYQPNGL